MRRWTRVTVVLTVVLTVIRVDGVSVVVAAANAAATGRWYVVVVLSAVTLYAVSVFRLQCVMLQ